MILAASDISKISFPMIFILTIVLTELWVYVQQGENNGEYFIFLLSEESEEAKKIVEQEGSQ